MQQIWLHEEKKRAFCLLSSKQWKSLQISSLLHLVLHWDTGAGDSVIDGCPDQETQAVGPVSPAQFTDVTESSVQSVTEPVSGPLILKTKHNKNTPDVWTVSVTISGQRSREVTYPH